MSSAVFREAFSKLQFVMALPTLMVGVPVLFGIAKAKGKGAAALARPGIRGAGSIHDRIWGWRPDGQSHFRLRHAHARALSCSHYRGEPGSGWAHVELLPASARPRSAGIARGCVLQIWLYGGGQLFACIGMFLAGSHGAPRKTPTSIAALADGAVIGMFLNGIGALFAIAGGVMIVVTVIRALWPNEPGRMRRGTWAGSKPRNVSTAMPCKIAILQRNVLFIGQLWQFGRSARANNYITNGTVRFAQET